MQLAFETLSKRQVTALLQHAQERVSTWHRGARLLISASSMHIFRQLLLLQVHANQKVPPGLTGAAMRHRHNSCPPEPAHPPLSCSIKQTCQVLHALPVLHAVTMSKHDDIFSLNMSSSTPSRQDAACALMAIQPVLERPDQSAECPLVALVLQAAACSSAPSGRWAACTARACSGCPSRPSATARS